MKVSSSSAVGIEPGTEKWHKRSKWTQIPFAKRQELLQSQLPLKSNELLHACNSSTYLLPLAQHAQWKAEAGWLL